MPWFRDWPAGEGFFWISVLVGYCIRSITESEHQKRRAIHLELEKSQLEASLNAAQLQVLRARLNPHFLFNSLQNISMMIRQNPRMATTMVAKLGDLLRAVLRQDSQSACSLEEEVKITRLYAELEQMRFGDRLQITFEIPPETERASVPCFVLQPLVENAIMHGLGNSEGLGIIAIVAELDLSDLVISVIDNGAGVSTAVSDLKYGIGLGTTRERLQRMFPGPDPVTLQASGKGGFGVNIRIPASFQSNDFQTRLHAVANS